MVDNELCCKPKFKKGNIKITVQEVHVGGDGVILLTGPSGCGKGEIAKALCKFLSIPEEKHLSMGDILRRTIDKARANDEFRHILAEKYCISDFISIIDREKNDIELVKKAESCLADIEAHFGGAKSFISQLDWLEFCVANGLLIPDVWTEKVIEALVETSPELRKGIFILDGYPRTVTAAQYLLETFNNLNIPVIKVLHLFITKEQMKIRASKRNRLDDNDDSLERRYQFYIEKVQPCIDYLKCQLGNAAVDLVDAHQPVYNEDGSMDVDASIYEVVITAMEALGLPRYLLDLK